MRNKAPPFTQEELKRLLTYSPDTGGFVRHLPKMDRVVTGSPNQKYAQIRIQNRGYGAHQLAWFYVHGVWCDRHLDHINGNPKDNRLANLRSVSPAVNLQNMSRPGRKNKSGYLGVCFVTGKRLWKAAIFANGQNKFLGYFKTAEEANSAYLAAKPIHHPLAEQCLRPVPESIV